MDYDANVLWYAWAVINNITDFIISPMYVSFFALRFFRHGSVVPFKSSCRDWVSALCLFVSYCDFLKIEKFFSSTGFSLGNEEELMNLVFKLSFALPS